MTLGARPQQQAPLEASGERCFEDILASSATLAGRAHLLLARQPGAGAWLETTPSSALGLLVLSALYPAMLQPRLRMPVYSRGV